MTTEKLSQKMTKLGKRGGNATKRKKGKKFFSKISLMRKTFKGGRQPTNGSETGKPASSNHP